MPVGINKQAEVMPLNNCISVEVFLPLLQKKKIVSLLLIAFNGLFI